MNSNETASVGIGAGDSVAPEAGAASTVENAIPSLSESGITRFCANCRRRINPERYYVRRVNGVEKAYFCSAKEVRSSEKKTQKPRNSRTLVKAYGESQP